MERLEAYKFELRPDGAQRRLMRRFAGSCRYVYNRALALQQQRFDHGESGFGYAQLCQQLTAWRSEALWLGAAHSQILQQALKDLQCAYRNFLERRAALPRLKKKGRRDSFRFPQGVKLDQPNERIYLPKLGWMRYRNSRAVAGKVCNVTVSSSAERWFVSIQTRREVERPVPQATGAIGIDVGIARFATMSDGRYLAPSNSFRKHEARLRRGQRAVSRKVKFSKNWRKARAHVQRLHARIGNVRRDYLHKATSMICKNHAIVCIEDLKVRNMSRSAAGSLESPGRNVRAKSGLNKSILDQGWFEFRRQLQYKLAWSGGTLIVVPPANTSRRCPACGCVSAQNRRTRAAFACIDCGFEENADVVGAVNILSRGMRLLRDEGQDADDASSGCECTARIACGETSPGLWGVGPGTPRSESA
jgi:putative transposase